MRDPFLVRMLDQFMTQDEIRTAIVVTRMEQFLPHVEDRRALSEAFGRWTAGRTENRCLLLFPQRRREGIVEILREERAYRTLAEYLDVAASRRSAPVFGRVGEPPVAELERLVHLVRVRHGLRIDDWAGLPNTLAAMAAESEIGAARWLDGLTALARSDLPLTGERLRRAGLLSGVLPDGRDVWERLDELVGLDPVKSYLRALARRAALDAARRDSGTDRAEPRALHLVFTGRPGTGKTTVARLVGEIYRDLGLLRRGQLVSAEVSDLVAGYVGQTAQNTNRIVDEALDGVLFIDEAYRLTEQVGGFGQEAIDTLLTRMENDRQRLVVIVAGYPGKITEFLDANPGLRSRFPASGVIDFPDYSPAELAEIALGELERGGSAWTPELADVVGQVTEGLFRTRDDSFGNARAMRDLASELRDSWSQRVLPDHVVRPTPAQLAAALATPLTPADLPARYQVHVAREVPPIEEVLAELDGLVGMAEVKDVLRALVNRLRHRQRLGATGIVAPHMLFLGPPGTGKTTVAGLVGRMLRSMGLLTRGHVVEATRERLVAGYLGQTALRTEERIAEAVDGVLFIDEAYSLARGGENDFGQEAIDTLTPAMERLRGRLVVVAAGYPAPMANFLARNEGLASRFTERVRFPDYALPELAEILDRMAAGQGYTVSPGARAAAGAWFARQKADHPLDFGNGRTVRNLLGVLEAALADRTLALPDDTDRAILTTFLAEDVPAVPGAPGAAGSGGGTAPKELRRAGGRADD
ncbi:AAA family ATPase [Frankia sp. QA3]|uniref:AAA family ATPase n=1 Tax=Frankia sp. QA3 TaxID=710111 RepID=UPI000269C4A3|nr:AAA family ATPase [Frankia sp. QA3]EIV94356.1 AAA+ family ATPase [Frankia sp. QA3]